MSGIYINFAPDNHVRAENAAARLKHFPEEYSDLIKTDFGYIAWGSFDKPELFGPATDPISGVTVLTFGRVSWDEQDWLKAESLDGYSGGLSCKLLLEGYLKYGEGALERPNGPAVVVAWDPQIKKLFVVTDHFGYQPLFLYSPGDINNCVIATCPDIIAEEPDVVTTQDKTSMAELLCSWRVTPPHTYYNEIKYAGAARIYNWDISNNTSSSREYWSPDFNNPSGSFNNMVEELEHAIFQSIKKRTLPRLAPVSLFVSGGMDSRAMLFSCGAKESASGINMYVKPGRERDVSKKLCEISGVKYIGVPLREDYYPKLAPEATKLNSGMNLLEDCHYIGIRDIVHDAGANTIMSACTADWLFKGYGLDKDFISFLWKKFPFYKFVDKRLPGFPPNPPEHIPEQFAEAIKQRHDEWYSGCPDRFETDADRLRCEDRRIRPTCYAVSISGPIMYRSYPYDTFFGDRMIADCYAKMRAEWKLNGDVWAAAVKRVCSGAENVVDSNFNIPLGASVMKKMLLFSAGVLKRKLVEKRKSKNSEKIPLETYSSWPNLGWYAVNSKTIHDFWHNVPTENRQLLSEVLGVDAWSIPLEEWGKDSHGFFRVLTLLFHWSNTEQVTKSSLHLRRES